MYNSVSHMAFPVYRCDCGESPIMRTAPPVYTPPAAFKRTPKPLITPKGSNTIAPPTRQIPTHVGCDTWSEFFNNDGPDSGPTPVDDGDYELIDVIKAKSGFCNFPGAVIDQIECRTVYNDHDYSSQHQQGVVCNTTVGFVCKNDLQFMPELPDIPGVCEDYKIRLFCKCPIPDPVAVGSTPKAFVTPPSFSTVSPPVRPTLTPTVTAGRSFIHTVLYILSDCSNLDDDNVRF